ncbi:flagellar hook capping protein [Termitidicoccus mucosus]|uniref:Basal-body rod modification protein FlgD n=1 Tax=Termitidicoccus mucosus TaxID=1184151 RepID=A0A178IF91_9BACT|nr:flagellar hook capping protein [Opitutaceae bacterium TSB47]
MSTISGIAPTSANSTADSTGSARVTKKELGQDDFLELLSVQLQNQDPLSPMDDTAFIAQMAQFSALSQTSALVKEMGYLRADVQLQAASTLLGKEVTVATGDGTITGVVDSIQADSSNVYLEVDGKLYAFGLVTGVAEPSPAATE